MSTKLFVGNLDFNTMEQQLRETFAEFGNLVSVTIITDRMTGRSRGFGFVEYETAEDAQKAIDAMDGQTLDGRSINVSVARERTGGDRGGSGGGRGGFGGGHGGGGGGGPRGGGRGGRKGGRGGDRGGRGRDRDGNEW
jgi:nucleolin